MRRQKKTDEVNHYLSDIDFLTDKNIKKKLHKFVVFVTKEETYQKEIKAETADEAVNIMRVRIAVNPRLLWRKNFKYSVMKLDEVKE